MSIAPSWLSRRLQMRTSAPHSRSVHDTSRITRAPLRAAVSTASFSRLAMLRATLARASPTMARIAINDSLSDVPLACCCFCAARFCSIRAAPVGATVAPARRRALRRAGGDRRKCECFIGHQGDSLHKSLRVTITIITIRAESQLN